MNVPAPVLASWLETDESASVGTHGVDSRWSVGQLAGWQSVELLAAPLASWTEADWRHARRTLGYVRRHRAQWPRGEVTHSRWRRSLRNWGHDPLWRERLEIPAAPGVVLLDQTPVGTLSWEPVGDHVEVTDLGIDPAWRNHGLATAVLHELACRHGGQLEVLVDSVTARGFFERRGFAALGPDLNWLHRSYPAK